MKKIIYSLTFGIFLISSQAFAQEDLCSEITSPVMAERCYGEVALENNDISVCHQNLSKGWCHAVFAIGKMDPSVCADLKEPARGTCYSEIAEGLEDESHCQDVKVENGWRDHCYIRVAVKKRTVSLCDFIKSSDLKIFCQAKVSPEEYAGGCSKIVQTDTRDNCYKEVARLNNDVTFCGKIEKPFKKNSCYFDQAQNQLDYTICKDISDQRFKNRCLASLSNAITDLAICHEMDMLKFQDNCYAKVSQETKDGSLCDLIQNETKKNMCQNAVGIVSNEE